MLRVLLLICGDPEAVIVEKHGAYETWFRAAMGTEMDLVMHDPRERPMDPVALAGFDALVISGSPHAAYEEHAWIAPLEELVREAVFRYRTPVLGVCFGHQLIAQALGGKVVKNPRGREMGTIEIVQTQLGRASATLSALPERFLAQVTHCDTVIQPPPGARVLATSSLDDCQAFEIETAVGVQYHPELSADVMRAYLEVRREKVMSEGIDADALHAAVRETDSGKVLFRRFLELAGESRRERAARIAARAAEGIALEADDTIRTTVVNAS